MSFHCRMARTRRSNRPRRKVNPLIAVLITGGTLLLILVVVLVVAKSMIESWLRGDEFREWLVNRTSSALSSRVELAPLSWRGREVYAESFLAEGHEEAAFARLEFDGLRARLGGIKDRAVQVPEIRVNRFDLEFSDDRVERETREPAVGSGAVRVDEPTGSGSGVPEWLRRYLPDRAEIGLVSLASARVEVKGADGVTSFLLRDIAAEIRPDFRTGIWEIEGRDGVMEVPDQPEIETRELAMRWKSEELFIDRCSFAIYEDGHVSGAGEISFAGEGLFDLDLEVSGIDLDDLVEGKWRERLSGTIEGPVGIHGSPGELIYEGMMNVEGAVIESVPVLSLIAEYTRNDRFKRLILSEARTRFRRDGENLELTDLVLQSDGLVRVTGAMTLSGDAIDGAFEVGVTPGTLRWIPGAERKIFLEEREGFLWAPMRLTGTVSEPREDLSPRLVAAAGEAILEELPEGLLDEARKFLGGEGEENDPSDDLIERGKPLLDLLTPFLKQP